jgi:hypothetical protein
LEELFDVEIGLDEDEMRCWRAERVRSGKLTDIYTFLGRVEVVDSISCTPPTQSREAHAVRNGVEYHACSRMVQLIEQILHHVVQSLEVH